MLVVRGRHDGGVISWGRHDRKSNNLWLEASIPEEHDTSLFVGKVAIHQHLH